MSKNIRRVALIEVQVGLADVDLGEQDYPDIRQATAVPKPESTVFVTGIEPGDGPINPDAVGELLECQLNDIVDAICKRVNG